MIPKTPVIVRGGGELGSAAARLLFHCGCSVTVLERTAPLAVRREVCFAQAVFAGTAHVDDVTGIRVEPQDLHDETSYVAVVIDPEGTLLKLRPKVLVDARMAKRNLGTRKDQAPLVIGLGPGFVAGEDVHAVVETQRGPLLGSVVWSGPAQVDTGLPSPVLGQTDSRVLRAPRGGVFRGACLIGTRVKAGLVLGQVGGADVVAPISGRVRGLIADGVEVGEGVKVGDIDPREDIDPRRLSDKGRAVAAGVLEAVLVFFKGSL